MNNENIKKIIKLLNEYNYKYGQIKKEIYKIRTNITLYEEILNLLSKNDLENSIKLIPLLLNTIYGNDTYEVEFYNILYSPQYITELNDFYLKIKDEYEQAKINIETLKNKKNEMYHSYISAKIVRRNILRKEAITNTKDIYNVKKIFEAYAIEGKISDKEKMLLMNEIELYSKNLTIKNVSESKKIYLKEQYNEIPNILMMGFQEPDKISLSQEKKQNLNKFVKELINQSIQLEPKKIVELLKEYQKYDLDKKEYNYIISQILDYYIDELVTIYSLLLKSNDSIYIQARNKYINEYYTNLDKYNEINKYYNDINENIEIDEKLTDIELKELTNTKRLIYSHLETNQSKSQLIRDMEDIPYEYYDIINDLLTRFKNGTIGTNKIKTLRYNNKNSGYIELKDDQVRIVLKHVAKDIYNVLGAFAKKDNNNMTMYKKIMNRTIPIIDTEDKLKIQLNIAQNTEEELKILFQEKSRKNSR